MQNLNLSFRSLMSRTALILPWSQVLRMCSHDLLPLKLTCSVDRSRKQTQISSLFFLDIFAGS